MRRGGEPDGRAAAYATVATALALHSDDHLADLVARATPLGTGIGGTTALAWVKGNPVFVKRIPLTDLERRPEHRMSTANVFGLPAFYHYGLGSAGVGAWRELAAHTMASNWVLAGRREGFPLLYHWRVLPGLPPAAAPSDVEHEIAERVGFWHGSPAVRHRLEAIATASASVVVFGEYIAHTVRDWLAEQAASGQAALAAACAMVERGLRTEIAAMAADGLWHFDAHFDNLLTDGHRVYVSDFGLACSPRFELSPHESAFLTDHRDHDAGHTVMELVNWLLTTVAGIAGWSGRIAFIRRHQRGAVPAELPPYAADIIRRHAPVALVMNEFYWRLSHETRTAPFPAAEVRRALLASWSAGATP